ncbi:MAG: hypothetical protein E7167_04475 [Firmicutes bacterium]|nr:hypothetical protein [Bacillota bacterium]
MRKFFASIKNRIKNINFKSKKTLLVIGVLAVLITSGAILISYSYYIEKGDKNLVISGYAALSDADVSLKMFQEERDENGNGTGEYRRIFSVPKENYFYISSKTTCTTGVTIDSYSNYVFSVSATKKGLCNVYFEAQDGFLPDSEFRLFVEQTKGAGDYEEMGRIPNNEYAYYVDLNNTSCGDENTVVKIVDRQIQVTTSSSLDCQIYAGIAKGNLSDTVIALGDGSNRTAADCSAYRVQHEIVTNGANTLDAGYRYEGANPDNYVTYNGELWRIVGTFDGADIGLHEGKKYTRIVRNDSIGRYAWNDTAITGSFVLSGSTRDTFYDNDWENAPLNELLNTSYLNQEDTFSSTSTVKGLNRASREMIAKNNANYSTWFVRAVFLQNYRASEYYINERISGPAAWKKVVQNAAATEVQSAIGLLYRSDLIYGIYDITADTVCPNSEEFNSFSSCATFNWLNKSYSSSYGFWTISPAAATQCNGSVCSGTVNLVVNNNLTTGMSSEGRYVYPTLYLKHDVLIGKGEGTQDNPYLLA